MEKTYSVIATDWGYLAAAWSDKGLWELTFPCAEAGQAVAALTTATGGEDAAAELAAPLTRELSLYFSGYRVDFGVPVDWSGYTAFQAAVLRHTMRIPYGVTQSYGEVAAAVGSPKAARAVGGALHINRTPIIVPCHRVVGSDGGLTGFGGGIELKRALLLLEREINRSEPGQSDKFPQDIAMASSLRV